MTRILYDPEEYRLCVSGHAAAAENGPDPVCAGISALAWALVEAATARKEYNAHLHIDNAMPKIDVQCFPEGKSGKRCIYMFEVIMGGLMLIAEADPEHVQIKIGGDRDGVHEKTH